LERLSKTLYFSKIDCLSWIAQSQIRSSRPLDLPLTHQQAIQSSEKEHSFPIKASSA
jgi:hypothetical protein